MIIILVNKTYQAYQNIAKKIYHKKTERYIHFQNILIMLKILNFEKIFFQIPYNLLVHRLFE